MKLIYWYIKNTEDDSMSIREQTKSAALQELKKRKNSEIYGKIQRVVAEYSSGFDLMKKCLSKERVFWAVIK